MIDRARIEAAWARLAHRLDPLEGDREAELLLRSPEQEEPGILRALDHMRMVDRETGGSLEGLGYGFVWDAALWRRATEANFQARALQQICQWRTHQSLNAEALTRIVIRHSFATNLDFGTPRHLQQDDVHFIVIPYSYLELLMLSARALEEMITQGPGEAWARLVSRQPMDATDAPPALRQLLARLLTDHAFHPAEPGENPVARLQAHSAWFRWDEGDSAPRGLETHLSYSALDFALAHEIGHRILDAAAPEQMQGVTLELAADLIGFRLYAASWGWRDDILETCPLSLAGRVLLGPIWFFRSVTLLLRIRQLLALRMEVDVPGSPSILRNRSRLDGHLAALAERWEAQRGHLTDYEHVLKGLGADIAAEDGSPLRSLADAIASFAGSLPRWVDAIPDADLRFAAEMPAI